jgi:hypothetical protein
MRTEKYWTERYMHSKDRSLDPEIKEAELLDLWPDIALPSLAAAALYQDRVEPKPDRPVDPKVSA